VSWANFKVENRKIAHVGTRPNQWKISKITENCCFHHFLSTLECRYDKSYSLNLLKLCMLKLLIKLYINYEFAKMYGDLMFDAHATSTQSLHVRKVRILLIPDFD